MLLIDHPPRKIAAPVSARTMKRLRAEKEMIFSITGWLSAFGSVDVRRRLRRFSCGSRASGRGRGHSAQGRLQPRLGIDQEICLRDHFFPCRDAFPNFVIAVDLRA